MAFTVETGTGVAGANAYVTTGEADTYHSDRGNTAWTGSSAVKQAAILKATTFIDSNYRFSGAKLTSTQGLEFPRSGLTDWSGNTITGCPQRLKDAVFELALISIGGTDLNPALAHGGRVQSEKVGSLSITYFDDATTTTSYQIVDKLLAQFIVEVIDPRSPGKPLSPTAFYSPTSATVTSDYGGKFKIGMTDYS